MFDKHSFVGIDSHILLTKKGNMRNFHYEVKIDFAYSTGGGVGKPKTEKEIQAEALSLMQHILETRKTQPKWFKVKKEYIKNGRSQ